MKKRIFLSLLILFGLFVITGCEKTSQNIDLLYGEWTYLGESGVDEAFFYYKFNEDGTFEHAKCMGDECENGEAEWTGTYKLNANRIQLEVKSSNEIKDRYGFKISIEKSLIVDFDNMYLCDSEEGLDCSEKYEK